MKNQSNVCNIDVCFATKELATTHYCNNCMTQLKFAHHHFVQTITKNCDSNSKPYYRADISFQNVKTKCLFIYERFGVSMEKFTLRWRMSFTSFASKTKSQLSNKCVLNKETQDIFGYYWCINSVYSQDYINRAGALNSGARPLFRLGNNNAE